MGMTEQIELLGRNLYNGEIPGILTLKSLPTTTELELVGAEEFDTKMLDEILPQALEEKIDTHKLLEFDYDYILRSLRILNYGPYYTTPLIICPTCNQIINQPAQVNLRTVECKPIPETMTKNEIRISHTEFIDFPNDIYIHLLTMGEVLAAKQDPLFKKPQNDESNKGGAAYAISDLGRTCYMIHHIADAAVTPLEAKSTIQSKMSPADYKLLLGKINEVTDFGLRSRGSCICPRCGSPKAAYPVFIDERFFRISVADIRKWRDDKNAERKDNNAGGTKKKRVQPDK